MWIGVHGGVYNITDFLPIYSGGILIVAASAGLDTSKAFDDLAHTGNSEMSSLLFKYFISLLAPKPEFRYAEISELYDFWAQYLRACVESLTTFSFEVNNIMKNSKV
jgi:cytochrome b involved in lipid metabolism